VGQPIGLPDGPGTVAVGALDLDEDGGLVAGRVVLVHDPAGRAGLLAGHAAQAVVRQGRLRAARARARALGRGAEEVVFVVDRLSRVGAAHDVDGLVEGVVRRGGQGAAGVALGADVAGGVVGAGGGGVDRGGAGGVLLLERPDE